MTEGSESRGAPALSPALVLAYGSQYTQLIARRIRELGVYAEVLGAHEPAEAVLARRPAGLVLSGGPQSVFAEGAPSTSE